MYEFLKSPEMLPFSGALLLVLGLVAIELVALLLGGSLMGFDAEGPDIDGLEAGVDAGLDADLDVDLDVEPGEGFFSALDDAEAVSGAGGAGGPLGWFGLSEAPFVIWLAGTATSFGIVGYMLQSSTAATFGAPMPALLAALVAAGPGLVCGKYVARAIGRLAPKTETAAVSRRHLGGRRGVITQGVAARGRPAECRVTDRHGNRQYLRVEPQDDALEIPQGTDVIVLRPVKGVFRVIPF